MKKSLNLIIISHAYVYSAYRAKIEALSEYHDLNIPLTSAYCFIWLHMYTCMSYIK